MSVKTILIVDDAPMERMKLSFALKKLGHEVIEATNGRDALAVAASSAIDLILLDLLMPEMDGFETLELLKADQRLCTIPVIVVSSADGQENTERARQLGARANMGKPFSQKTLQDALAFLH